MNRARNIFYEIIKVIGVLIACRINIMGYYVFLPAMFCHCLREEGNKYSIYVATIVGAWLWMPLDCAVKYWFVLLICRIGIGFYIWGNRSCSEWVAGTIGAIATTTMNISVQMLNSLQIEDIILAVGECLCVVGITVIISHFVGFLRSIEIRKNDFGQVIQTIPIERRIRAVTDAIEGLSGAIVGMVMEEQNNKEDRISALEVEVTGSVCACCDVCALCWNENRGSLRESIRKMISSVMEHKSADDIIKENNIGNCKNHKLMMDAAIMAFGRMELNEAWYKRLCENRIIVAKQLNAMTELMDNWSRDEKSEDSKYKLKKAKIIQSIKEVGGEISEIHFWRNSEDRIRIEIRIRSRWGNEIDINKVKEKIEKIYGTYLRIEGDGGKSLDENFVTIELYEERNYYALPGIATQRKQGSVVSGDNFSIFELEKGVYNICLSDGMGSGKKACRESGMVVDLIEKFIDAGFEKETAIKLMNSAMVLYGENDSFSTLDYSSIDLYSGRVGIIKIGAAATFIKRTNRVDYYLSDSLPAGVDVNQNVKALKTNMSSGDFLVMVTDGVLEYLNDSNPEEKMAEIIKSIDTDNAGVMAKNILDAALELSGGYAMDDMTVLTVGLWEK